MTRCNITNLFFVMILENASNIIAGSLALRNMDNVWWAFLLIGLIGSFTGKEAENACEKVYHRIDTR